MYIGDKVWCKYTKQTYISIKGSLKFRMEFLMVLTVEVADALSGFRMSFRVSPLRMCFLNPSCDYGTSRIEQRQEQIPCSAHSDEP